MPDVFISYSKVDKALAERLARQLKQHDLDVWWDADLYASQDYHDAIMQALNDCKAAIVIWSFTAVTSPWVRDEATRAKHHRKLIPTYVPPFTLEHIPLGFGQMQSVSVDDLPAIREALRKHDLQPSTASYGRHLLAELRELKRKKPPPRRA